MPAKVPKPVCFVAMPFGKKSPPDGSAPPIRSDEVWRHFAGAVRAAGLEPKRADFETAGGFIHKHMFERLLVAEYVIADLTLSNPNVLYEVGVRHASTARATLLVCADSYIKKQPFDTKPFRIIPYHLDKDGCLTGRAATSLKSNLRKQLLQARQGQLPVSNPIMQLTSWIPKGEVEHNKTDVFMERMAYVGEVGERIKRAVGTRSRKVAIKELGTIERELLASGTDVAQYNSALMGVYLGYREREAYDKMVKLFKRFPTELRHTPVAREQYALALNRLAEKAAKKGTGGRQRAMQLRRSAIAELDKIPKRSVTSETYGIRGRIYKGWYDAELRARRQRKADAMLGKAIDTYEAGLRADARDYYPGVNAVTLRLLRGTPQDLAAVDTLAPVVRFAARWAAKPENEEERYWRAATELELAAADRDWKAANRHLDKALQVDAKDWMHETTVKNLGIQLAAFQDDEKAVASLKEIISGLSE